jgi:hypothetical protein
MPASLCAQDAHRVGTETPATSKGGVVAPARLADTTDRYLGSPTITS